MPQCKEKEAAENWVAATFLQHMSGAETRQCRNRKPHWESEQWMSSSLCQNNYLSLRRVDFPMKLRHGARKKNYAGAVKKKKKITDVFVLVMVPLTRRKFEQRRQQEELSTWQLIQSIWCSISHCMWSSAAQLCASNRSFGAKLQQPARPLRVKVSRFFLVFHKVTGKKVPGWAV